MIGQAREHAALFVLDDEGEVAWRRGVERGRRAAVGVGRDGGFPHGALDAALVVAQASRAVGGELRDGLACHDGEGERPVGAGLEEAVDEQEFERALLVPRDPAEGLGCGHVDAALSDGGFRVPAPAEHGVGGRDQKADVFRGGPDAAVFEALEQQTALERARSGGERQREGCAAFGVRLDGLHLHLVERALEGRGVDEGPAGELGERDVAGGRENEACAHGLLRSGGAVGHGERGVDAEVSGLHPAGRPLDHAGRKAHRLGREVADRRMVGGEHDVAREQVDADFARHGVRRNAPVGRCGAFGRKCGGGLEHRAARGVGDAQRHGHACGEPVPVRGLHDHACVHGFAGTVDAALREDEAREAVLGDEAPCGAEVVVMVDVGGVGEREPSEVARCFVRDDDGGGRLFAFESARRCKACGAGFVRRDGFERDAVGTEQHGAKAGGGNAPDEVGRMDDVAAVAGGLGDEGRVGDEHAFGGDGRNAPTVLRLLLARERDLEEPCASAGKLRLVERERRKAPSRRNGNDAVGSLGEGLGIRDGLVCAPVLGRERKVGIPDALDAPADAVDAVGHEREGSRARERHHAAGLQESDCGAGVGRRKDGRPAVGEHGALFGTEARGKRQMEEVAGPGLEKKADAVGRGVGVLRDRDGDGRAAREYVGRDGLLVHACGQSRDAHRRDDVRGLREERGPEHELVDLLERFGARRTERGLAHLVEAVGGRNRVAHERLPESRLHDGMAAVSCRPLARGLREGDADVGRVAERAHGELHVEARAEMVPDEDGLAERESAS